MKSKFLFLVSLLVLAAVAAPFAFAVNKDFSELDGVSKPIYRKHVSKAWLTHGRMVGQVAHPPPKYDIVFNKILRPAGGTPDKPVPALVEETVFRDEEHGSDLSVYESSWLPPGKYQVTIKAEGFHDYAIPEVEIKKGFDCIIDIKFSTHVYHIY